jgi:hypothetical protein
LVVILFLSPELEVIGFNERELDDKPPRETRDRLRTRLPIRIERVKYKPIRSNITIGCDAQGIRIQFVGD